MSGPENEPGEPVHERLMGEARLKELSERSSDIELVLEFDGAIVEVNDRAVQAHGYLPAELKRLNVRDLRRPSTLPDLPAQLAGMARPGGDTFQAEHLRRDGSAFPVEVRSRAFVVEGKDYLHCLVRDLTAAHEDEARLNAKLRRLEDQLLQAQKLESVGRLAGGVAHDFNNLLTVISSCAEQLHADLEAGVQPSVADVEEIRAAGDRACDLTRQLLAFSRKRVIEPVVLELSGLLRGTEKLLRRVLGEDVALSVQVQPGLWLVRCDPGLVEQVLMNLAVNARDAMPGGGEVRVEASNVELDEPLVSLHPFLRAGPFVRLSVRDNGLGMSDAVKSHIFEPFFTTKPQDKGTGLGLATVYGIVKQSLGYIVVESAPNRGSTFTVYLPRVLDGITPASSLGRSGKSPGGTERLLVAEDDPQVRAVMARALRAGGYEVLVAGSGEEALELERREEGVIDLVVTDVVLQGLGGRALMDDLRERRPGLRVLYLSGYTHDQIALRGVLDGGAHFLSKPYTASVLLARVRAVLDEALPAAGTVSRFAWNSDLAIGDPEIDRQHQALFEAAARFEEAVRGGAPAPRLQELFRFLAGYVSTHFRDEERLMARIGYPDLAGHVREHERFTARLERLAPRFGAGEDAIAGCAVLYGVVQDWLVEHVGTSDQRLREHRATRPDPAST